MSYRSIKNVLGETNLGLKCLLLFGACMLVLIGGVFYWVENNAEHLVIATTRRNGRDLVDMIMLKTHFMRWETLAERKPLVRSLIEDLEHQNQAIQYEILALDDQSSISEIQGRQASDPAEIQVLRDLAAKLQQQESLAQQTSEELDAANLPIPLAQRASEERPPVFADLRLPDRNEYLYYEPIYWKQSCLGCHYTPQPAQTEAGSSLAASPLPMRFIKVVIPDEPTQDAITWNWCILVTGWIVTVLISLAALYAITRYVILKPLQHLRDVSDAISRGDIDMRAEIHTNDEFEELAASFNRMLWHLTDAQAELRELNKDLDGKVDELAQLNVRLYEMNRIKGDFLANMSHELRTPLNSIIGFSEVLSGIDSLTDKQKRYARNIQKSGRLLLDMINDILDLAKMEAGKMEVRLSEFRIDAVINAQCDLVRSLTEEKNIDLDVQTQPETPPLFQDQVKVQQILTNLLSNAIKFTPEGGRITVSAFMAKNGLLHINVADTGVGIAAEDREIIFEKFRQSTAVLGDDGLTREYSGTGLGLSIVKEMCKLLGGEISFESELGKGSTFTVTLPWTRAPQPRRDSQLNSKLNEITKAKRSDFGRVNHAEAQEVAAAVGEHNQPQRE